MRGFVLLSCVLLTACQSAPESGAPKPNALESHGIALLNARQHEEARGVFLEALRAEPGSLIAVLGLAQAATATGDRAEAERALRRAMESKAESAAALSLIGRAALNMAALCPAKAAALRKSYALIALQFLQRAGRAGEHSTALLRDLGRAGIAAGQPAGAVTPLMLAFEREPTAENATLLRECWIAQGQQARCAALLQSLRKAGPVDPAIERALTVPSQ